MWPPVPGEYVDIPNKKNFHKVDPVCKLQVISALDSGQSKVELAKQYGLHPTILTYIYRQKEFLTKTYKEKLENSVQDVRSMNLDLLLLDWLMTEIKEGNLVSEDDLSEKVEEFLGPAFEEFSNVQDWIKEFRTKHSVVNYSLNVIDDAASKEEWMRVLNSYSENNVYVGGTCGLWHSLDLDGFLAGTSPESNVSIMMVTNASGSDKRPLLVVGIDSIAPEDVQSLPLKYYKQPSTSLITISTLKKYLLEWDCQLNITKQTVALVLDIPPEYHEHINLCNIKLIQLKSITWIRKAIDKITHCYKYNYRRTQITKRCLYTHAPELFLTSCSHTISYAWHCLTVKFIQHLLYPPCEKSLLKICNESEVKIKELSLSEWSQATSLPLGLEKVHTKLDEFIVCDQHLESISKESESQDSEGMAIDNEAEPIHVADAFQAMRRLAMYLQGESAKENIIQSGRVLENHVEYSLLMEVQRNVPKSENSTNKN